MHLRAGRTMALSTFVSVFDGLMVLGVCRFGMCEAGVEERDIS